MKTRPKIRPQKSVWDRALETIAIGVLIYGVILVLQHWSTLPDTNTLLRSYFRASFHLFEPPCCEPRFLQCQFVPGVQLPTFCSAVVMFGFTMGTAHAFNDKAEFLSSLQMGCRHARQSLFTYFKSCPERYVGCNETLAIPQTLFIVVIVLNIVGFNLQGERHLLVPLLLIVAVVFRTEYHRSKNIATSGSSSRAMLSRSTAAIHQTR